MGSPICSKVAEIYLQILEETHIKQWLESREKVYYKRTRNQSAQPTSRTPFRDMLPHLHTIYNDVILLSVLTEK